MTTQSNVHLLVNEVFKYEKVLLLFSCESDEIFVGNDLPKGFIRFFSMICGVWNAC